MSQDTLLLFIRLVGISLTILLTGIVVTKLLQFVNGSDDESFENNIKRKSQRNTKIFTKNSEGKYKIFENKIFKNKESPEIQNTSEAATKTAPRIKEPQANIPVTVMARVNNKIPSEKLDEVVKRCGLMRSPTGIYEMVSGENVIFSLLNIRSPGSFKENLADEAPFEGFTLVVQLPVAGFKAATLIEDLLSISQEIADICGGRLCDYARIPLSQKDILKYHQAAREFDKDYENWQLKQIQ